MHLSKFRAFLILAILCFMLTLLDIIVVECHYRPISGWDSIWFWHIIYTIIFISIPLFVAYYLKTSIPIATYFYFLFGIEDTVFYGIQGYLPKQYPGIQIFGIWEPALNQVLQLNLLGLTIIVIYILINWKYQIPEKFFSKLNPQSTIYKINFMLGRRQKRNQEYT